MLKKISKYIKREFVGIIKITKRRNVLLYDSYILKLLCINNKIYELIVARNFSIIKGKAIDARMENYVAVMS